MRILLVDLSSIVHPIWHVSGSDPDPDHVSTATVGRVRELASRADRTVVCCDSRKTFRKELSRDYKAQRDTKPEALFFQANRAKEILADDGYAVLERDGFEADDVIATSVRLLSSVEDVEEIVIASADKDLAQLVRDTDEDGRVPPVRILSLASNEMRGPAEVMAKFGVAPEQLGDWLALVGDTSDNVKGADGIGDKKATALLTRFGSLVGIFGAVERSSSAEEWAAVWKDDPRSRLVGGPAVFRSLKACGAQVALARKLVELRSDVPMTIDDVLNPPAPGPAAPESTPLVDEDDAYATDEPATYGNEQEEQNTMATMDPTATTVVNEQVIDQQTGEVTMQQVQVQTAPAPQSTAIVQQPATQAAPATNGKAKELDRLLSAPVSFERALEPTTSAGAVAIAGHLFASKMFSKFPNADAVLGAILLGRELGLGAMGSLRGIALIEGKYGLAADLMVALVLKSGKAMYFEPVVDANGRVQVDEKHAVYRTRRVGRSEIVMEWKIEEAERAKILKKDSGWEKWPADMNRARCIARMARAIYPDVVHGLYVTEELKDGVE